MAFESVRRIRPPSGLWSSSTTPVHFLYLGLAFLGSGRFTVLDVAKKLIGSCSDDTVMKEQSLTILKLKILSFLKKLTFSLLQNTQRIDFGGQMPSKGGFVFNVVSSLCKEL